MVDKALRVPKEQVLTPIASRFFHHIHPTTITLLAFGVGMAAGIAVWQQAYGLGVGLWILNRVLDGLDGTVARVNDKQTEFGGYLDIVLDTCIYAVIPYVDRPQYSDIWGLARLMFLMVSFYINAASWMYLAALLEKRSLGAQSKGELTTITMPGGLIEGTETVILFHTSFCSFRPAHIACSSSWAHWSMRRLCNACFGRCASYEARVAWQLR